MKAMNFVYHALTVVCNTFIATELHIHIFRGSGATHYLYTSFIRFLLLKDFYSMVNTQVSD